MTNDNTDTTDEPTKAELHDRVQQLESTVEKLMPSRRDALKLGAVGIAGAAGLGAATQPADASTGSAGTIGSSGSRPDLLADEIDANTLSGSIKNQGCRVFLSSGQSISQSAREKIQFDTEAYDSDNNFDTSTHNWTCPQDGLYMANLQVRIGGSGGDQSRQLVIGTATDALPDNEGAVSQHVSSDNEDRLSVSTINEYSSGDTIAAYFINFGNSDLVQGGSGNDRTFLEVAFLGGL